MNYDVKAIQAASKQRYIDLGIYVVGCDILGYHGTDDERACNTHVNNLVKSGRLCQISELDCLDCGEQAQDRHHNLSYRREHWVVGFLYVSLAI